MTDMVLGGVPGELLINLVKDSDFAVGIDSEDGDWSGTCVVTLKFNDSSSTVWTATRSAASLDWNQDKAAVAALVGRLPAKPTVQLIYTDGGTDLVWMSGTVIARGF